VLVLVLVLVPPVPPVPVVPPPFPLVVPLVLVVLLVVDSELLQAMNAAGGRARSARMPSLDAEDDEWFMINPPLVFPSCVDLRAACRR
jgi:hypothetical protein